MTGLVYSLYIGRRKGWGSDRLQYAPHSISHVFLGTILLWFGWLGFNGGSTFAANLRAAMAITTTNLAAACELAFKSAYMFTDQAAQSLE